MIKNRVKPLRLNPNLLMSKNNGIHVLPKLFEKMVFSGKSSELSSDLNKIMFELTHWSHRLFPSISFDDFLERVEQLGYKRSVKVFVKKIRLDLPLNLDPDEYIANKDSDNEEQEMDTNNKTGNDLFDSIVNKHNNFGEISAKSDDKRILNSVESNEFNETDVNYGMDSEEDEELDTFLNNNFDKKSINNDNDGQELNINDSETITKNNSNSDGDNEEDDEVQYSSIRYKRRKMILNNDSDNEEQEIDTNDKTGNDLFDSIVNKHNNFGEISAKSDDKRILSSVESNEFNETDVNYGMDSEEDDELDTFLNNNFNKKSINNDNDGQELNINDSETITKNNANSDGDNEEDDEVQYSSIRYKRRKMILNNDSDNEEQ